MSHLRHTGSSSSGVSGNFLELPSLRDNLTPSASDEEEGRGLLTPFTPQSAAPSPTYSPAPGRDAASSPSDERWHGTELPIVGKGKFDFLPRWVALRCARYPAIAFCLLMLGYVILCSLLLTALLAWTPFGWQGKHISAMTPASQQYAHLGWQEYGKRLKKEQETMPAHPSGSLAAARLTQWRMQRPAAPDLNPDVPVSQPINEQRGMLPQIPIDPKYDPTKPNHPLGDRFDLVTFASSVYFQRVLNLIGSVHFWEPFQRIVIYDLGFTQEQVLQLQCIDNIEVRPFDFEIYPAHVRNLFQYYFKPLLVYDALQHASSVLVLDSGIELRQQLSSIKLILERDGYFLAGQPNTIGRKSLPESFRQLGVEKAPYDTIQFCAGGMFGFVRSAPAYELVAKQAAICALKPDCYSPPLGGRDNHNFDQSINSILVYKYGFHCSHERRFREMEMSRCPIRHDRYFPEEQQGVLLCIRRWHEPKPYVTHVRLNEACLHWMADSSRIGIPNGMIPESWMYTVRDRGLIEHTQGSHQPGGGAMAKCLLANNNNRANCTAEIHQHESGMRRRRKQMRALGGADYFKALLFAGLRMPTTYLIFAALFYAILRQAYGQAWLQQKQLPLIIGWIAFWAALFALIQSIDKKFDR